MITAEELAALYPKRGSRRPDLNGFELRHAGHPLGEDYRIDPKTGCWIWRWSLKNGRPMILHKNRRALVNRLLLGIEDLDPYAYKALHRLDVCSGRPDCINPDHVYAGNQDDYKNELKIRQYWKGYSIWR